MSDAPDKWDELPIVHAGKRLGVQNPVWMGDDWFTSWSPRNSNSNAEGVWCQWVHMARLILADPRTAEQMPEFALPYPDPPFVYDGHHPACRRREPEPGQ